jgi:carbon-monoxide dehydrogenase medium subunit
MRLPPFELYAPHTVEEATELLDRLGDEAAIYGGGTELLLLLKLGFADYRHLVDVKGIAELHGIRADRGALSIGAAVTHRELESAPVVLERWPALAAMERRVANLRVRNAGTLGGNVCFADPHSDPATFLLATDATLIARRGGRAARVIPAAEFVRGPYQTALEPGELLLAVEVPEPPPGSRTVHTKLAFHERPAATVTAGARVQDGRVTEARVAVGSVGPVPARAPKAEAILESLDAEVPDPLALEAAGVAAAEAAGAVEDSNGSVEYKRDLVRVLVKRAFVEALRSAA